MDPRGRVHAPGTGTMIRCTRISECGGSGRIKDRPCPHCSVLKHWSLYKESNGLPLTQHNVPCLPESVYEVTCPRCSGDRTEHFYGANITTGSCGHCTGDLQIKPLQTPTGRFVTDLPPRLLRQNTEFVAVEDKTQGLPSPTGRTSMTMQDEDTHLRALYKEVEEALTEEYTKATGTKARSLGHVMELLTKARDHSYAIASTRHTAVAAAENELAREKEHTRRLEDRVVEVEREVVKTKEGEVWKKMTSLQLRFDAKVSETLALQAEREVYRKQEEKVQQELVTLKGWIERLNVNLEENRRALALREMELDDARQSVSNLQTNYSALMREDEKTRQELDRRKDDLLRAQDARTRAQQELALKSIDLTNLKERYEREKKEVEMNEVKEARRENAEILAALKTLTAPKETTMSDLKNEPKTQPSMMQKIAASKAVATLKVDASDAGWRVAGSQFIKLTKEPLVALLSRHLGPDDDALRGRIAAFLDTELGTAILSAFLSAGLSAVPGEPNALPAMMARELRVRSMAGAGDVIADVLMGPLRQVAVMYLQAPAEPGAPAALPGSTGFGDNVVDMNTGARAKVG